MAKRTMLTPVLFFIAAAWMSATPITIAAPGSSPEKNQPTANPSAIIVMGHARITVLTAQLLRLEWAADGKFEDHASFTFLNRNLPVPQFQQCVTGSADERTLTLDTGALHLVYRAGIAGAEFSSENLSIRLLVSGKDTAWHPGMEDSGNLFGTARTLDTVEGGNVRLEPGLLSRSGWSLVDDSERPLFDSPDFSMAKGEDSAWPWVLRRPAGKRLDWYFFGYGHDYGKAMGDFVKVAGRIPLPPRFAFGNWWSRYWAYSDQELNDLVSDYRIRSIPLDVLVIDMDWHRTFLEDETDQSGHRKGWSGYTWNRNLFPEPEKFLRSLHDRGLKVTLNLHPASGVQPFEDAYPSMARAMGQNPAEQKYVPFQITDRKFVENYFDILHHPLERQGVDFWWLDWQQEQNTSVAGVNPIFWLNYLHFTDQEREDKRPLIFHRWGGLGNHRYEIGFSGDTVSTWRSLAFQPGFTATAANVGYAYWSHDIGGHIPGAIDPELYTRWVQWGAFSPIFRTHTTKNPDAERRVWAYPEPYSDIMADIIRQRYAWIPYIYTEARRTYDTGVAFLRPLYYEWPEEDEAYKSANEFLFGDHIIVAPVTTPVNPQTGLAMESIWLPQGQWIEQSSGSHIRGPIRLTRGFSIQQTPVYMRSGAIVPMQPPMLYVGAGPVDPLIVRIAPLEDKQSSSYMLYEDSSSSRAYTEGQYATTGLHAVRDGSILTVTVDAVKGSYPDMPPRRAIRVELPDDWPPVSVTVNGQSVPFVGHSAVLGWQFIGNTLTTSILTASFAVNESVTVVIKRDSASVSHSGLLNGFAGKMVELRLAYAEMNNVWPIEDLVAAMQTGNRLEYHPDRARAEIEALPSLVASAQRSLEVIAKEQREKNIQVGQNNAADTVTITKRKQENAQRIVRARAALAAAEDIYLSPISVQPDSPANTGHR